jgi:hypothetical protein
VAIGLDAYNLSLRAFGLKETEVFSTFNTYHPTILSIVNVALQVIF